jgi:hypothetical protein
MFYLLKHINNLLRSQVHYIKEHVFVNGLHFADRPVLEVMI